MKLAFFASSIATLMLAQATDAVPAINAAYAYKDLTLAGVLLVAVGYLYRELGRERKTSGERHAARDSEVKAFISTQAELMKSASDSQSEALGQVANALGRQQAALDTLCTIQREHINRILDAATKKDG